MIDLAISLSSITAIIFIYNSHAFMFMPVAYLLIMLPSYGLLSYMQYLFSYTYEAFKSSPETPAWVNIRLYCPKPERTFR